VPLRRLGWLTLALALSCFSAATAEAQTDAERAGARSAATAGADAFEGGKYQDALDLFQRAESLVHSPVHLSYIGQCHANLGHLVEAHETFLRLSREELPANARDAVKRAVSEASDRAKQLEPRLPYLAIKLQGAVPGETAEVTLNGAVVPGALIGIPAPTNPGDYIVRATAPGKDSGEVKVTLQEGERKDALVTLQSTGEVPPVAPVPAAAATSTTATEPVTPQDDGAQGSSLKLPAYAALGVGAVGVVLGTYFALDAGKAADEADDMCGGSRSKCTPQSGVSHDDIESKNDQAGSSRTMAIVGFAVGGVGLAAGATMLVLSMSDSSDTATSKPGVVPYVGFGEAGVVGRF
jgi:hypothetical protein